MTGAEGELEQEKERKSLEAEQKTSGEQEKDTEDQKAVSGEDVDSPKEESSEEVSDEAEEYDWDAEEDSVDPNYNPFAEDQGDIDLGDAEDEDDTARDILYESAKEYVKKEDAYKDMLFSGLTFIIFGIIGEAYLLLCKLDIIPINYNIVVLSGLAIMFLLFLIGGVVSVVKSARIKTEIPVVQEKTRRIKEWMAENLTQEIVQKWENPEVSQAENDLVIMAHIRSDLMKQYPEEDAAYLEMIAEEYFTEHIQTDED